MLARRLAQLERLHRSQFPHKRVSFFVNPLVVLIGLYLFLDELFPIKQRLLSLLGHAGGRQLRGEESYTVQKLNLELSVTNKKSNFSMGIGLWTKIEKSAD